MSTLPGQSHPAVNNMNHQQQQQNTEGDESAADEYYGNFARRVYFMADVEGWNQKKIVHYFNNMQAFEKFYANVSSNMSATLGTRKHA